MVLISIYCCYLKVKSLVPVCSPAFKKLNATIVISFQGSYASSDPIDRILHSLSETPEGSMPF